jgi:mannose-6-phosphate isomerase-like protein (cupin superfamily)
VIIDKPWGKVATYALNQPASVRMITVEPEQETSVHYHRMRDEMWVVLDPGLTVEIGNRVVEAQAGEEFMVAAEETHRIRNVGSTRGRVLEIAYGYTTEDDTQRLEGRLRTSARGRLVTRRRHPRRAAPILTGQQGRSMSAVRAPARPVLVFRKR